MRRNFEFRGFLIATRAKLEVTSVYILNPGNSLACGWIFDGLIGARNKNFGGKFKFELQSGRERNRCC